MADETIVLTKAVYEFLLAEIREVNRLVGERIPDTDGASMAQRVGALCEVFDALVHDLSDDSDVLDTGTTLH